MRLIDADALMKKADWFSYADDYGEVDEFQYIDPEDVENAPTVDAVEVVHGRWDDSGRYHFVGGGVAVCCTICGCALYPEEYERFHWNYCPVCGAKMDLKGE